MGKKLQEEIQQKRPFESLEEEALLNIHRTADRIQRKHQLTLKVYGLTPSQYNVLRILRGAEPDGLRCSDIGDRMVSHDPDITRLLTRLERRRYTERRRDTRDRRVVFTRITKTGLKQLQELDPVIHSASKQTLGHMQPARLALLIDLLEEARETFDDSIIKKIRRPAAKA